MKRDLLREVYEGSISPEQADGIYDAANDEDVASVRDNLGLTLIEDTAYGYLRPDELAKWRYEGWPNICQVCEKEIQDVQKGGWVIKRIDGDPRLIHLTCLPRPTKEERQLVEEFQGRSFPENENSYQRETALSVIKRATELNLAVIWVQGLIILDGKFEEAPEDLAYYCWAKVKGETWEEFRDNCNACIQDFVRNVPSREGLTFYLEVEPELEWPWLKTRREEIQREEEEKAGRA